MQIDLPQASSSSLDIVRELLSQVSITISGQIGVTRFVVGCKPIAKRILRSRLSKTNHGVDVYKICCHVLQSRDKVVNIDVS